MYLNIIKNKKANEVKNKIKKEIYSDVLSDKKNWSNIIKLLKLKK